MFDFFSVKAIFIKYFMNQLVNVIRKFVIIDIQILLSSMFFFPTSMIL